MSGSPSSGGFLDGPVDHWADTLTDLAVRHGMDTFICWPREAPLEQLRLFAEDGAPRVRAMVNREHGSQAR